MADIFPVYTGKKKTDSPKASAFVPSCRKISREDSYVRIPESIAFASGLFHTHEDAYVSFSIIIYSLYGDG